MFCSNFVGSESGLIGIGNVKEAVGVLSLLVDLAHHVFTLENIASIHKEVERVLLRKSDPLADNETKLIGSEITGSQVSMKT